jgi:hypothetical protein
MAIVLAIAITSTTMTITTVPIAAAIKGHQQEVKVVAPIG